MPSRVTQSGLTQLSIRLQCTLAKRQDALGLENAALSGAAEGAFHEECGGCACMVSGVDVKQTLFYSTNNLVAEHQVGAVSMGNQNPLCAVQALSFTSAKEAFDLLVHTTYGKNLTMLVHSACHPNVLLNGQTRQRGEQCIQLRARCGIAFDATVLLLKNH